MYDASDLRYGPAPPVPYRAISAQRAQHLLVLLTQWIACVAFLTVVRPPFVLHRAHHVSLPQVVAWATAATTTTVVLHVAQVHPTDTFTRACEFFYHLSKA